MRAHPVARFRSGPRTARFAAQRRFIAEHRDVAPRHATVALGTVGMIVGTLALMAPASGAAATRSDFVARADQTCRQYFTAVVTLDGKIKRQLDPATTAHAKIVLTADLLGFNGRLSLNTYTRLSRLRAPGASESLWRSALRSDHAAGTLTLRLAERLTQLDTSQAANAAISAYDLTYQRVEMTWIRDVKQLHLRDCV
jgi:hypothetical protein